MTLLADVVAASREVAETSSRSRKVAILANLLRTLDPSEVAIAVGFLSGLPRQGRVGVGYSTVYGIERPPAREPSLTIHELDRAITDVRRRRAAGRARDGSRFWATSSRGRRTRKPTSSGGSSPAR